MEKKDINFALIGCGYWGKNHLRVLNEMEGVRLKTVCDFKSPSVKIPSGIKFTANCEEVLNDKNIEAVVIATPTITHYDLTRKFLDAKKHVLVEKPLATKVDEARELCKLSSEDSKLMVGEIFRFNPAVGYIKSLIDNKELGELRYFESRRVGLGPVRNDVSALWDLATHDIYISNLFAGGPPREVSYQGISHNKLLDDIVCLNLKYGSGILATIYVNWEHPTKERKIIVGGTKKAVLFDDVAQSEKVAVYSRGVEYQPVPDSFSEFQASTRDGDTLIPRIKITQPLEEELKHFVRYINNQEECISDGYRALETVKVLEAAEFSNKSGGLEVSLQL